MGIFIDQVRKSQIPHPTQRTFTPDRWKKSYNEIDLAVEEDIQLYNAGIWVFDQLTKIREKLNDVSLDFLPKKTAIRLFCGDMNRTLNVIYKKSPPTLNNKTVIAEQLIQAKVSGNIFGIDYYPDQLLTSELDGARFPLIYILSRKEKTSNTKCKNDIEVLRRMKIMMLLGQYYSALEDIWTDCLWNGLRIDQKDDIDILYRIDDTLEKIRAVSGFREQELVLQAIQLTFSMWKLSLNDKIKRELAQRYIVNVSGSGKKRKYKLQIEPYDADYPPKSLIFRLLAQEAYFDDLVKLEMPNFSNITLEYLLTSWEIIFSLSESLMKKLPKKDDIYNIKKLIQFAPAIKKRDLIGLLSTGLDVNYGLAAKILDLLTFKPKPKCEIWTRPLIELDSKSLLPVFAGVLSCNLLRTVEHWLKYSGIDFSAKGELFEKAVQASLKRSLKNSAVIKDYYVYPKSISFSCGNRTEELDIVVTIGNRILLGEAKCIVFPTEPLDYYNYFLTLKHGVKQIKRKADFVIENIGVFIKDILNAKETHFDSIDVIPFVVINRSLGVGFTLEDVPIVDQLILNRYLRDGKWEKYVYFDNGGNKTVGETVRFYSTEKEAGENIRDYIENPPQIDLFKKFITVTKEPLPLMDKSSRKAIFLKYEINFPLPDSKLT